MPLLPEQKKWGLHFVLHACVGLAVWSFAASEPAFYLAAWNSIKLYYANFCAWSQIWNTACMQSNIVLSCLVSLRAAAAMFHKRDKEYQEGLPLSKKLKANIGDLYLSNQISAQSAEEIHKDVADAGLLSADMKHLSKGLHSGIAKKLGRDPNAARDLAGDS